MVHFRKKAAQGTLENQDCFCKEGDVCLKEHSFFTQRLHFLKGKQIWKHKENCAFLKE